MSQHLLQKNQVQSKKIQKVLVKGVILDKTDKLVLLLKNRYDYWDLPGGHLDFEETPEECLQREVQEEIGATIKIEHLTHIQTVILDLRNMNRAEIRHYLVLIYQCCLATSLDPSFISNDHDTLKWKWFPVKEVIENGEELPVLPIIKEQLLARKKPIRTQSKVYIRGGELSPFKTKKYK